MQKSKIVVILLAVSMILTVSCGRKGTGCPTFSKATTEQNLSIKG